MVLLVILSQNSLWFFKTWWSQKDGLGGGSLITLGDVTNVGLVALRLQMASYVPLSTVKPEGLLSFGLGTWAWGLLIFISGLVNVGVLLVFLKSVGLWNCFPPKFGYPFLMCWLTGEHYSIPVLSWCGWFTVVRVSVPDSIFDYVGLTLEYKMFLIGTILTLWADNLWLPSFHSN